MKLNHDCVRIVLMHVEENIDYGHYLAVSEVEHEDFKTEDLLYAADKLIDAGYLDGTKTKSIGSTFLDIRITSLTWSGHQFLDNIRDESVWDNTKKVVSKFSSVSLSMIGNIASQVITSIIQKQIG